MSTEESLIILGVVLAVLAIAIIRRLTKLAKRLTDINSTLLHIAANQSAATLVNAVDGDAPTLPQPRNQKP